MPDSVPLVVIAYHNGSRYLSGLLPRLSGPVAVVDTGSTAEEFEALLDFVRQGQRPVSVSSVAGGFCTEAYRHAFCAFPGREDYFFMHDSLAIKDPEFLAAFRARRAPVVAWIGFPLDLGAPNSPEQYWLQQTYGPATAWPATAIFGPIFYATGEAMRAALPHWPPPLRNRHELCASERGLAITFARAGYGVEYLEEYSNERLDQQRDYRYFDKFRPNRE